MDYQEQLKDKRWKLKRLKILKRDRFKCRVCGYMGNRVNVHHLKYTGMAWESPDEDLITLCRDCHSKLHVDKWPAGKSLGDIIKEHYGIWLKD